MAFEDTVDLIKNSLSHTDDDGIIPDTNDEPPSPEDANGEPPVEDGNELGGDVVPDEAEPETPAEPVVEEPAAPAAAEPKVEEPKPAAKDETAEEAFAREHGIKAKDAKGRENRIPYSAVVRINANAVKKATETLTKTYTEELTKRDTLIKDYTQRLEDVGVTEKIMFQEHGKFLGMLIQAIPGYKELLGNAVKVDEKGWVVGVNPAAPADVLDPNDPEPQADIDEGNGRVGYSPQQFAKLRAWDRRQAAAIGAKSAQEQLDKTYRPVLSAYETHTKATTRDRERKAAMDGQIAEAQTWPGWDQHWEATLKAMQDDYNAHSKDQQYQFKDIRSAYLHVLNTKASAIVETQAQMEARIRKAEQERLRNAPRSTNAGGSVTAAGIERDQPVVEGAKSTADLVRASIKQR